MRKFKMSLAVLATSAAVLTPAGVASATGVTSTSATGGSLVSFCEGPNACRDATLLDVEGVNVCGISILDFNAVLAGSKDKVYCSNGNGKWIQGK
jgi:hypothetical protein